MTPEPVADDRHADTVAEVLAVRCAVCDAQPGKPCVYSEPWPEDGIRRGDPAPWVHRFGGRLLAASLDDGVHLAVLVEDLRRRPRGAVMTNPHPMTGHGSHQHRDTSGLVITLCTTCNRAFVNEDAHQAWVEEQA